MQARTDMTGTGGDARQGGAAEEDPRDLMTVDVDADVDDEDAEAGPAEVEHIVAFELRGLDGKLWCGQVKPVVVAVSCGAGCDLTGGRVTLCDAGGAVLGESSLRKDVKGWAKSDTLDVRLPADPGLHQLTVLFESDEVLFPAQAPARVPDAPVAGGEGTDSAEQGDGSDQASALSAEKPDAPDGEAPGDDPIPVHQTVEHQVTIKVRPHKLTTIAWGIIGSHMVTGEKVTITAGARCEAGCDLEGRAIRIVDADVDDDADLDSDEAVIAEVPLDYYGGPMGDHWCHDFRLKVPAPGHHTWKIVFPADGAHEGFERALTFSVLASEPNAELTARVYDRRGTPLEGCTIDVTAPGESAYRGKTDETGLAFVKVPEGLYRVNATRADMLGQTVRDVGIVAGELNEVEFYLEEDWNI